MDAAPVPFTDLMAHIVAGSASAARQLYERFSPDVRQAVRDELPKGLRSKCDSDDLLQEVWGDFFTRVIKTCQPQSPEEFVGLLRQLAHCRTVDAVRKFCGTAARDLARERSLERDPLTHRLAVGMAGGEIRPDEIVAFNDFWERLVDAQEGRLDRCILLMLRDGWSYAEIAQWCEVAESTVRRAVQRIARARNHPKFAPDAPW